MVAVLVIPDGAAEPIGAGPTSLEAARTPVLDALAGGGVVARVATTPAGWQAGSETGLPALLGRPPTAPVGRGWIDAAAHAVTIPAGLMPWRADVLTEAGERASGGATRRAAAVLSARGLPAVATRAHRVVVLAAQRPPDGPLPGGLRVRVWTGGPPPDGRLDAGTVVVCGPGAAAGCGRLLGATVLVPANTTGDVDTDLDAKADAALAAVARGAPCVVVHVGAPDEAAHRRDAGAKVAALEAIDARLLAPLLQAVATVGGSLAVCPDHGTDPATGVHEGAPVPAVRWGASLRAAGPERCHERAARTASVHGAWWPLHGATARAEAAA